MDIIDRLVVDFSIWFKRNFLRYDDTKNLRAILVGLGGLGIKRREYIISRFDKTLCPTCKGEGYVD